MKRSACFALAALAALVSGSVHAAPVATARTYGLNGNQPYFEDANVSALLPAADNLLYGIAPVAVEGAIRSGMGNNGVYWEVQADSPACLTDGAIPTHEDTSNWNKESNARWLVSDNSTLTWTFAEPQDLGNVRLWTQWPDGYRTDIAVSAIQVTTDGSTWTTLANSSFCSGKSTGDAAVQNTILPFLDGMPHFRMVTYADETGGPLATGVTGLRIVFPEQELGYTCFWEIEAERGGEANSLASLSFTPSDVRANVSGRAVLSGDSGSAVLLYGTDASSLSRSATFAIGSDGSFSGELADLLMGTTYFYELEIVEGNEVTGSGSGSFRTIAFETFGDCAVVNGAAASDGSDAVITFTESGRIRFPKAVTLDVLVVGGGGGGGNGGYSGGGGGGASAVSNWERVAGTGTEGQGHDGGRNLRTAVLAAAQNGDVEATVVKNASGQEFNGGGGGGGAGAPGGSGSFIVKEYREDNGVYTAFCDYYYAGNGGDGIACSITGEELWYGGGGGGGLGGWYRNGSESSGGKGGGGKGGTYNDWAYDGDPTHGFKRNGEDAVDGTGGGGGGGGSNGNENSASNGGRGGSGIVIVRFTQRFADDSNVGTGGTISKKDGYMIHTFTEDGTFDIPNSTYAEILVVGGGGGGGEAVHGGGGGGGAGGFIHRARYALLAGTYPVRVGAGGAVNMPGGDSALGGLVAYGGGAGNHGYSDPYDGNNGGSGGGAAGINNYKKAGGTGIAGQGHDGGSNFQKTLEDQGALPEGYTFVNGFTQEINLGGGGGGAGAPGGGGTFTNAVPEEGKWFRTWEFWPGVGGDGLPCSITGEEVWYAGGGGGGQFGWGQTGRLADGGRGGGGKGGAVSDDNYWIDGENGVDGTGGGGGGGGHRGDNVKSLGGAGGSGIVIIRYKLRPSATILFIR